MAIKYIDTSLLTNIANAIRTKLSSVDTYKPSEMPQAIMEIETGITPTGTINIVSNGVKDVTTYASANVNVPNPSTGTVNITSNGVVDVTTYASADVNVPNPSTGTVSITQNGTVDVTQYASAAVNVPNPSTGTKNITANGSYDVTTYANASVAVPVPTIQASKQVSITENGSVNITPDSGNDAMGAVALTVNVSGVTPTGTFTATSNGNYDITNYARVEVAIPYYEGG